MKQMFEKKDTYRLYDFEPIIITEELLNKLKQRNINISKLKFNSDNTISILKAKKDSTSIKIKMDADILEDAFYMFKVKSSNKNELNSYWDMLTNIMSRNYLKQRHDEIN